MTAIKQMPARRRLTVEEVRVRLLHEAGVEVNEDTVRRLARTGRCSAIRVGKRLFFDPSEIDELIAGRR